MSDVEWRIVEHRNSEWSGYELTIMVWSDRWEDPEVRFGIDAHDRIERTIRSYVVDSVNRYSAYFSSETHVVPRDRPSWLGHLFGGEQARRLSGVYETPVAMDHFARLGRAEVADVDLLVGADADSIGSLEPMLMSFAELITPLSSAQPPHVIGGRLHTLRGHVDVVCWASEGNVVIVWPTGGAGRPDPPADNPFGIPTEVVPQEETDGPDIFGSRDG